MEKTAFKNRFRIIAPNGTICRLNYDSRWVEGFDTLLEAQQTRNVYFANAPNLEDYKIEPYAEPVRLLVPIVKKKELNKELARRKIFSGKALKFNSPLRAKDENKYQPGKFYSREVWLAQSTERSKGKSINAKFREKKLSSAHEHDATVKDMNHGYFMESNILASLKSKNFKNRKELWLHLKPRGFSQRQMKKYAHQLWTA